MTVSETTCDGPLLRLGGTIKEVMDEMLRRRQQREMETQAANEAEAQKDAQEILNYITKKEKASMLGLPFEVDEAMEAKIDEGVRQQEEMLPADVQDAIEAQTATKDQVKELIALLQNGLDEMA